MSTYTDSLSAVMIQTFVQSIPSPPSWFGEVAVVAQVLKHVGVLKAIQDYITLDGK